MGLNTLDSERSINTESGLNQRQVSCQSAVIITHGLSGADPPASGVGSLELVTQLQSPRFEWGLSTWVVGTAQAVRSVGLPTAIAEHPLLTVAVTHRAVSLANMRQ